MATSNSGVSRYGAWLMVVASILALILSAYNYFTPGTGIDQSGGALLVIVSSALILLASLVLAIAATIPRWLDRTLTVLLFLGVLGTAAAAYFLETQVLIGLMVIVLLGWLAYVFGRDSAVEGTGTLSSGAMQ